MGTWAETSGCLWPPGRCALSRHVMIYLSILVPPKAQGRTFPRANRNNLTPVAKWGPLIGGLRFPVSLQSLSLSIRNIGNNTWQYAIVCLTFKMASALPTPHFNRPCLFPSAVLQALSQQSSLRTGGEYGFQGNKPSHAAPRDCSETRAVRDHVFFKGNCVTFTRVDGGAGDAACAAPAFCRRARAPTQPRQINGTS